MANKNVFSSNRSGSAPPADTINNAGGAAYSLTDKEALAQLIITGVFNNSFYVSAKDQINNVKNLLDKLGPENAEFVAKLAVYARQNGFMKDTPAYLLAWLSKNGQDYFKQIFDRVIDNGKMLRNFVQIMRSGAIGRKSLGTLPKKMVKNWLANASVNQIMRASVGNSPSLADVIKMVHPTPNSMQQNAIFQWILGGKIENASNLPNVIKELTEFRLDNSKKMPNVPFELLTSCKLSTENWKDIARNAGWHMTRMNLNTFERNGLFNDEEMVYTIAAKLSDTNEILKSKVFPYQIFTTWMNASSAPIPIRDALKKALDFSLQTIPVFDGKTYVFVDVSGSMSSPITGYREGATSKMRCVDVAALIASSLLQANRDNVEVVMFDTRVHRAQLPIKNSVMENAEIIASFGGAGTASQLPLEDLVFRNKKGDLIIYVSDNESWLNSSRFSWIGSNGTQTANAWEKFKKYNPKAKMICIDLTPNVTTQVKTDKNVLNIGGFSDAVYDVIANFASQSENNNFWVNEIETMISF